MELKEKVPPHDMDAEHEEVFQEVRGFDQAKEIRSVMEEAVQKIYRLTDAKQTIKIFSLSDIILESTRLIDEHYKNKSAVSGIETGLTQLDSMITGFHNSEMIIIGARPFMGNTALVLSMLQHIAIEKQIPAGFFSLEMSRNQIGQRLLSQVARVSGTRLRNGLLKLEDFKKIHNAASECYSAPLYIVDTPSMQLLDLFATARRMKARYDVRIIFIDCLGLITMGINDRMEIYTQQSLISKSLKELACELDIPIVVLCQFGLDAEEKDPDLAQMREFGLIDQNADVVMFIHNERPMLENDEEYTHIQKRIINVAKQRNGPNGDVPVLFISSYTKFEDISYETEK